MVASEGTAMHELDDEAAATKDCARCGGRAFYWRSAVVAGTPLGATAQFSAAGHRQPAWTCMQCGYIQPHERRTVSRDPLQRTSVRW
jgi:hypothetical protein